MTLSVCLIVRDEEDVIARCLSCVKKFADEIIVVDTGSSDFTVEEVKKFTDKIYFFNWQDDFSAARNFAFEKATCDYVMWLDADDVITAENCTHIRNLVENGTFDMAYLVYASAFDGDTPTFKYNRERIFKRSGNYRFSGAVHEAVIPHGNIVYSEARIDHKKIKSGDSMRNLKIYQKQIVRGIPLDERSKFYYGRELMYNKMYREASAVLENFLSGNGWVENKIEACINLYYCYSALKEEHAAHVSLLNSLLYSPPRPQFCCIIGGIFAEKGDISSAIYWYKQALDCGRGTLKSGAFINTDFYEFIPCMQLCVLYDRLGDLETANNYNECAGRVKPDSAEYLYNRQYFQNKLSKEVINE